MDRLPEQSAILHRYLRIVIETFFAIAAPKIIAASVQQK